MTATRDRNRVLTRVALDRLLERLDPDRDAAAREYERIRRRLVAFFDWRGSPSPDVDADETIDRVAHKLLGGEAIECLLGYVSGVARRVLHEAARQRAREQVAARELVNRVAGAAWPSDVERQIDCLERCLNALPEDSRALIVDYYSGSGAVHLEGRKALAERLGLSPATLKMRAYRVRARIEECLRECLEGGGQRNQ